MAALGLKQCTCDSWKRNRSLGNPSRRGQCLVRMSRVHEIAMFGAGDMTDE